ncbi:putative protein kinase RLK-Pelle-RLCK-VIIa-2 family [Helianthus anomalus]
MSERKRRLVVDDAGVEKLNYWRLGFRLGRLYVKSDVYAFGVVMLEIITGLRAYEYTYNSMKQNLVEWAKPFLTNIKELQNIIDPRLDQDYHWSRLRSKQRRGAWSTSSQFIWF